MTLVNWGSRRDHLAAPLPSGDYRFIALDVETACSEAASICQIGIACVRPDNHIETFATLVNPQTYFSAFNTQLHGIGPAHVADAPDFAQVFDQLAPLLSRHHLIQHSGFDKRAVNADTDSYGATYTYALSKRTNLNAVLTRFNNKGAGQVAPGGNGFLGGVTASAGTDSTNIAFGIRHTF